MVGVTSRSFHRRDSRNHLLFHRVPSNTENATLSFLSLSLSFSFSLFHALSPSFFQLHVCLFLCLSRLLLVAQLYGNCSLTNRLNPLFSFQGEDNHPLRTNQSFDLPSFVDPLRPTSQPAPVFDLPSGFPRLVDYFASVSAGFSTPAKWPRQPFSLERDTFFWEWYTYVCIQVRDRYWIELKKNGFQNTCDENRKRRPRWGRREWFKRWLQKVKKDTVMC